MKATTPCAAEKEKSEFLPTRQSPARYSSFLDPFEELVQRFRSIGLHQAASHSQARIQVIAGSKLENSPVFYLTSTQSLFKRAQVIGFLSQTTRPLSNSKPRLQDPQHEEDQKGREGGRREEDRKQSSDFECRADLQSSFRPEAAEVTPGAPAPGSTKDPRCKSEGVGCIGCPGHAGLLGGPRPRVGSSQLLPQPPPGLPAARVGPGSRAARAPRFPPFPGELTSSRASPFSPAWDPLRPPAAAGRALPLSRASPTLLSRPRGLLDPPPWSRVQFLVEESGSRNLGTQRKRLLAAPAEGQAWVLLNARLTLGQGLRLFSCFLPFCPAPFHPVSHFSSFVF